MVLIKHMRQTDNYAARRRVLIQQILNKGVKVLANPPLIFKTIMNPRLERINIRSILAVPESLFGLDAEAREVFGMRNPILCLQRPRNIGDIVTCSTYKFDIDERNLHMHIPDNHLSVLFERANGGSS
jgi:hypothetical protein